MTKGVGSHLSSMQSQAPLCGELDGRPPRRRPPLSTPHPHCDRRNGWTALHCVSAASGDRSDIASALLASADSVGVPSGGSAWLMQAVDGKGRTALQMAIQKGKSAVIRVLTDAHNEMTEEVSAERAICTALGCDPEAI